MTEEGPDRFARYAYPPQALGYCGPQGERTVAEATPDDLRTLAQRFEGAWPYLELIGNASGLDPLDPRVVDAYWLGNELAAAVPQAAFERHLRPAVDGRTGLPWEEITADIAAGGRPTHAFHVFSASPWVSLLARGFGDEPLRVLNGCRIAWGEVVSLDLDHAVVRAEPLVWNGERLALGPADEHRRRIAGEGVALDRPPSPGQVVALHWDWVCEPLDDRRLRNLCEATDHQLALVNRRLTETERA